MEQIMCIENDSFLPTSLREKRLGQVDSRFESFIDPR